MSDQLKHSMFHGVLFPQVTNQSNQPEDLMLRRAVKFQARPEFFWKDMTFVVFDFETTGLDQNFDRVIEVGAQKIRNFQVIDQFESFIDVEQTLSSTVTKLTGISQDMLAGQPKAPQVFSDFLKFIQGGVLVAHNASFDMNFLRAECSRLSWDVEWSAFCTLKLSRALLPDLESRTLDKLAAHYGLSFEARHRSIGDVKVTVKVLENILQKEGAYLSQWKQFGDFEV